MPTSKDILDDAKKALKENTPSDVAMKDIIDTAVADTAAFGKAAALLKSSLASMKTTSKNLDDNLKELNAAMSTLEKNEAVMKAPADEKAYNAIMKELKETIKATMKYDKTIDDLTKTAQGLL